VVAESEQVGGRRRLHLGRLLAFALAVMVVVAFGSVAGAATPGSLDPSFGAGGEVVQSLGFYSSASDIAEQPDGKLVVAGTAASNWALSRVNRDGSPDASFGTGGVVSTNVGGSNASGFGATAVAVTGDGRIVAVGYQAGGGIRMGRYNADGSVDSSFSSGGASTLPAGGVGLHVLADGSMLTGFAVYADASTIGVAHVTANGALDPSFGLQGLAQVSFGRGNSLKGFAVQPDGKIVLVGATSGSNGLPVFAVARLTSSGTLDSTFGVNGKLTLSFLSRESDAASVVVQSDGKILVAGTSWPSPFTASFAVARLNSDGSLDSTFGTGGKVTTSFLPDSACCDLGGYVLLQSDGKIVVVGSADTAQTTHSDFVVIRYNPNGSLDTSFGVGGKAFASFTTAVSFAAVARVTGAGITVAGETHATADLGASLFAMARFVASADSTPPSTTDDAVAGWFNTAQTLHLTAVDDASGVAATYYRIDGATMQQGSAVGVPAPSDHSNDGSHTITYWSVDNAGNQEQPHSVVVNIDTAPPSIIATRQPDPNGAGWNNTPVAVWFTCADATSGVSACSSPTVLADGENQSVTGTAVDAAGNTATATVSNINVDQAAPSLAGVATTQPNGNGWYAGDVVIHWTCSDSLSGIASGACPADDTISGEGTTLTAAGSIADNAGNLTTAASEPVRIDRTPPRTTAAAPSGWSTTGVTIPLTASDNLSGVATTYYQLDADATTVGNSLNIDQEGIHILHYWSIDNAGNTEPPHTDYIEIERTAPTITHQLDPNPNSAGWNNSAVSVTFTCGGSISGITSCSPPTSVSSEGAGQAVTGDVRDNAGLTASDTAYVSIDETPPSARLEADRPPNTDGWYQAPVQISSTCTDSLSGVATCPSAITLGEGANQTATGIATDVAGNDRNAAIGPLNIDLSAPTISFTGNAGTYTIDQTIHISCQATDALSGIAATTCTEVFAPAYTFNLGSNSLGASATDRADNSTTSTTTFTVTNSCSALESLVRQFDSDAADVSSFISQIESICAATTQQAKTGKVGAFANHIDAQTGTTLTVAHAAILKRLAAAL
jgi:uncharacterized delta-60 repeat protein